MFVRYLRAALLGAALTTASPWLSAATRIATWNLEHFSVRPNKDFDSIAQVASQVDFLAIQEVMNEDALAKLASLLSRRTGEHWSYLASHAKVGRSSYKEMYGFVWRDSAIRAVDSGATYLDPGDAFAREPFAARFHSVADRSDFVAATVHITFGKSAKDRSGEIEALSDYWRWLRSSYADTRNVLLMGDFNTPPNKPVWQRLDASAMPLFTSGKSTLSAKDGVYANLYDNMFVPKVSGIRVNRAQVYPYPQVLKMSHKQARASVSDHAPLFLDATLSAGRD